jgi:hypothetical protein
MDMVSEVIGLSPANRAEETLGVVMWQGWLWSRRRPIKHSAMGWLNVYQLDTQKRELMTRQILSRPVCLKRWHHHRIVNSTHHGLPGRFQQHIANVV